VVWDHDVHESDETEGDADTRIRENFKLPILEETGEARIWLVFNHEGHIVTHSLPPGACLTVGRDPAVGVPFVCTACPRLHGGIGRDGDLVWVEDARSSNGTFINGQRIKERRAIHPGDEIVMGAVVLLLQSTDARSEDRPGLDTHDRFVRVVEHEVMRGGE